MIEIIDRLSIKEREHIAKLQTQLTSITNLYRLPTDFEYLAEFNNEFDK